MSAAEIVRSHPHGALLTVWVVPGARRTEIVGYHGDALRVRVAVPPEKGKANKAIVQLLSESLGPDFRLLSGAGSRRKRFVAMSVSPDELVARLETLLD